ncbi:acyl-CoA thioesterase [Microbacterium caowuchunii]|uniref:acyl-CoA thioesterase n=1 Tax=Microbacterium caowuchunii TaxID=2614638 RepID=UPI0012467E6C|nr:thioesterase family protein [Microbacterium caowuchunii]QEW01209.1 acyl-CoA thioesterase [Microbacterium caowuchunii]
MTTPRYGTRRPFATRWRDNDQYGHLNNTVYYEAMDTAVNAWMIEAGGLRPRGDEPIALCASSSCEFHASASFPDPLEVGIAVERLGRSSIIWRLGILRAGEDGPLAEGRFVHVFVDPSSRVPTPIPEGIRTAVTTHLGID